MRHFLLALAVIAALAVPVGLHAQADPKSNVFLGGDKPKKEKNPTSRSVKGMVIDAEGKPLDGALVTLTKTDTKVSNTFVTKKDGRYNFDYLSFTTDYKLSAQYKSGKSELKTLSQYDRTPYIVRMLAIDTAGKPSDAPAAISQK